MRDYIKATGPNGLWFHRRRTPEEARTHKVMTNWQNGQYRSKGEGRSRVSGLHRAVAVLGYLEERGARHSGN